MYYIFNAEHVCIGKCNAEPNQADLESRGEYVEALIEVIGIGDSRVNGVVTPKAETINYPVMARSLRDGLRNRIDIYLMPASTIGDVLVTDEQRQTLIADSLALAAWPGSEGWPFIELPELSELFNSLIGVPVWDVKI